MTERRVPFMNFITYPPYFLGLARYAWQPKQFNQKHLRRQQQLQKKTIHQKLRQSQLPEPWRPIIGLTAVSS